MRSVGGYIRIYLVVYGPENKGDFGFEGKPKAICGLGRTNYGGLWNVRPPIIDTLTSPVVFLSRELTCPQEYKSKKQNF